MRIILSRRRSRAGDAFRPSRCHPQEPDTDRTAGMSRHWRCRSPRTFSALASGRCHESRYRERKRTRQAEKNPTAWVREFRKKRTRKGRATKISFETANVLQRDGKAPKRARRHRVVNCASPAVSSFARSGRKFVETGRRDFPERPWCVAESFLMTTAPGSADLAQNLVRKGRPLQGARNRDLCATRLPAA